MLAKVSELYLRRDEPGWRQGAHARVARGTATQIALVPSHGTYRYAAPACNCVQLRNSGKVPVGARGRICRAAWIVVVLVLCALSVVAQATLDGMAADVYDWAAMLVKLLA